MSMQVPARLADTVSEMRSMFWWVTEHWVEEGEATRSDVDHMRAVLNELVGSPYVIDGDSQDVRIARIYAWLSELYQVTPMPRRSVRPGSVAVWPIHSTRQGG